MGFVVTCESCEKRLSIPPTLYEKKVRGRVVTITCRSCQAIIRVDATLPPSPSSGPPARQRSAPAPSQPSGRRSASVQPPRLGVAPGRRRSDPPTSRRRSGGTPATRLPESRPLDAGAGEDAPSTDFSDANHPEIPRPPALPQVPGIVSESAVAFEADDALDALPIADAEPATRTGALGRGWEEVPEGAVSEGSLLVLRQSASRESEHPSGPGSEERTRTVPAGRHTPGSSEPAPPLIEHATGPISEQMPIASIGRYTLFDKFATGGMATVHFGRLDGAGGFSRVVALKRLLAHLVQNSEFVEMLLKEARLAGRVRHPNVVQTLDVVASRDDVLIVLEYVHGESLSALCRTLVGRRQLIDIEIAISIMLGALRGLHAVHEATDERGRPLGLVHRDVSPANVVVGVDGLARVLDFGIVKALELVEETMPNRVKGKTGYMSPEQAKGDRVTRRSDVFSAGIVLWEILTLRRFVAAKTDRERIDQILAGRYEPPSSFRPELSQDLDRVVMKALAFEPEDRFATTREFAEALESLSKPASSGKLADWVNALAAPALAERARSVAQVENWTGATVPNLSSNPYPTEVAILQPQSVPPPASVLPPKIEFSFSVWRNKAAPRSSFGTSVAVLLLLAILALGAFYLLKLGL